MIKVIIRKDREKRLELYFPYEVSSYGFATSLTRHEGHNSACHEYMLKLTTPSDDKKNALILLKNCKYDINQIKFIKKVNLKKQWELLT
tara:strand:- start:227 stop:493 length:267 start_codon:yes stop_codon:yes gene_type:complete